MSKGQGDRQVTESSVGKALDCKRWGNSLLQGGLYILATEAVL